MPGRKAASRAALLGAVALAGSHSPSDDEDSLPRIPTNGLSRDQPPKALSLKQQEAVRN